MSSFHFTPEWQGPLSGRSFEKQVEDAVNVILQKLDEVSAAQAQIPALQDAVEDLDIRVTDLENNA